jgi:thymidylate synthase
MNNLDKQYTALLQDILDNGVTKKDRTGTGTLSVFGRQIRHKMSEGFPLLTTKKVNFNAVKVELLWFLKGETNIKYLINNGCNIWNGDAYKNYCKKYLGSMAHQVKNMAHQVKNAVTQDDVPVSQKDFAERIKNDDKFAKRYGDLGPIYGKQWRKWGRKPNKYGEYELNPIDQIKWLICDLKENPDSRRLMVSAWNVDEIDEMVLPPCHYGFQVYTTLSNKADVDNWYKEQLGDAYKEFKFISDGKKMCIENQEYENAANLRDEEIAFMEKHNLNTKAPVRKISLMWNQRSVDTFLGLPFNIASYGLLLEIIAKEVNMIPDELIGNLGDTHLYLNHLEQAVKQIGRKYTTEERVEMYNNNDAESAFDAHDWGYLEDILNENNIPHRTREPFKLPTLDNLPNKWDKLIPETINLSNYKYHGPIKAPLSN